MKYKITHSTTYKYTAPVAVCHNYVMLTPCEEFPVKLQMHRLVIRPTPQVSDRRRDAFGNIVHTFSIEENHRQLSVTSTSRVDISERILPPHHQSPNWQDIANGIAEQTDINWLEACQFIFDSPRIKSHPDFVNFAKQSFTKGRPILEAAMDLTTRIYKYFKYDTTATNVNTPPDEAFRLAKGVCQDFAQVQIASLRSLGLAARYVSGYLRTIPPPGKPRLVGADQSHAWVSLYCGQELGWVEFDPTNNCVVGTDHIPIARGRDYGDVTPMKGVFLGGGEHTLNVSVDVCPIEEPTRKQAAARPKADSPAE